MPVERHDHDRHQKATPAKPAALRHGNSRRQADQKKHKADDSETSRENVTDAQQDRATDQNVNEEDIVHLQNGDERVMLANSDETRTNDATENNATDNDITENDEKSKNSNANPADDRPTSATHNSIADETGSIGSERSSTPFMSSSKINHDNFDIRSFNSNISDFVELFSDPRYQDVDSDYPVDDIISVVSMVSASIDEFKSYTQQSQHHLEDLRSKMKTVKENIHLSVTRKAFEIRDDEYQSVEERELTQKLATLNAACAKANADVAEAVRLSAETESTAVKAQLSAEKAKEEVKRIEEEIERKAEIAAQRKAEEDRRREEERAREEELRRREDEEKQVKEAEWRRRELIAMEKNPWEKWPIHEYTDADQAIVFILRGHPSEFEKDDVRYKVIDPNSLEIKFTDHEELIGTIIELVSARPQIQLPEPVYLAIPHLMTRGGAASREPVIKAKVDDAWVELPTKEVTFENHKDLKFAQAEVTSLSTFIVTSRFKRDFVTFGRKLTKVVSSFDHRITMTVPKNTFTQKEHLLFQVQPVDSATVNDFRSRHQFGKSLLTSSPVVFTEWECDAFKNKITVTLPCPPNPAKAKKLAQIRKMKEDKMKQPVRGGLAILEDQEREERKRLRQHVMEIEEGERKGQGRWYMGEYGASDDDEADLLYFMVYQHAKWIVVPSVKVMQVKVELVTFDLSHKYDRFMIIRTRTNVDEELAGKLTSSLTVHLSKRHARAILKQRSNDPLDLAFYMVPSTRMEKTLNMLTEDGYQDGPTVSHDLSISEGETIEISFRGNIKNGDKPLELHYHSNMTPNLYFRVSEVDKYLQKNFPMYRGVISVSRKYVVNVPEVRSLTRKEEDTSQELEIKRDFLCDLLISIPKYHIEPSTAPMKAPITIHNTRDPVNEDYIEQLAHELGEEWLRVAHYLDVQRVRLQSILRNIQINEKSTNQAKFDMLMTWLKRAPKSANKVAILSTALIRSGRGDLAEQVRTRELDFRKQKIGSR